MLLVQPDAPDFMHLIESNQLEFREFCRSVFASALLSLKDAPQPVFAPFLQVRAWNRSIMEELNLTTHPPVVTAIPVIGLIQFVAEFKERHHPRLLLVV